MIKICGITSLEDAHRSLEYGATALGFNLYENSPRYVEPALAEEIMKQLPAGTLTVAVIVVTSDRSPVTGHRSSVTGEESDDFLSSVIRHPSFVTALQLHGLTSESEIPPNNKRVFVATSFSLADQFPHQELIIDTSWGRGQKADWEELKKLPRPFILSGGLTPENVAEAIRKVRPAGVDVCSGVESSPGKKDPDKLKRFIQTVRSSFHG